MTEDAGKPQAATALAPAPDSVGAVSVDPCGRLVVPADALVRAGIAPGDEVVIDAGPEGLRIASDSLRKVYVETTSHCNLDCPMCVRHGWQEPVGHMPVDRFERLIGGLPVTDAGALTLAFGGFGEPLVHPEWLDLFDLARARRLRVEMVTNGLLVDAATATEIALAGVSQVTVSVDGGDAATYMRMRGASLDGALAAVRHLLDARCHTRRPMAVGVAAVLSRSSAGGLPALLEWASDLKIDFVSIGNLVPHTQEMASEILWERTGWASAFLRSSWRPQMRVGRFDVEDATRPLAAALAERGLTYPSPFGDDSPVAQPLPVRARGPVRRRVGRPCLAVPFPAPRARRAHQQPGSPRVPSTWSATSTSDRWPRSGATPASGHSVGGCARSISRPVFTAAAAPSPNRTSRTAMATRRPCAASASGPRESSCARDRDWVNRLEAGSPTREEEQ